MTARDAAIAELDAAVDAIATDAATAVELGDGGVAGRHRA